MAGNGIDLRNVGTGLKDMIIGLSSHLLYNIVIKYAAASTPDINATVQKSLKQ